MMPPRGPIDLTTAQQVSWLRWSLSMRVQSGELTPGMVLDLLAQEVTYWEAVRERLITARIEERA